MTRRADAIVPKERRCQVCGVTKPASEFYAAKQNRDGLVTYCRVCGAAASRARQARRRLAMGDEAYRADQREKTRKSRTNPDVKLRQGASAGARWAALERLAKMYPKAFDQFLREERSARGLRPDARRPNKPGDDRR
jgi:hypothetical protein